MVACVYCWCPRTLQVVIDETVLIEAHTLSTIHSNLIIAGNKIN